MIAITTDFHRSGYRTAGEAQKSTHHWNTLRDTNRVSRAEQQSYENMATGWIDTILARYTEVDRMYNGSAPWNAKRVQRLIVAQVADSQKFGRKLEKAQELMPDYVLASACVHYEAAQVWDWRDTVGWRQVLRTGHEFASKLLMDEGILHTLLRNSQPAFDADNLPRIKAMRAYFDRRLSELQ
jgi:hypothetical protein